MILKIRTTLLLIIIIFSSVIVAVPSRAQEIDYDRINDIAEKLNCPTCAGINLADCRTQTCEQWRGQIGDLIQEGYSDQEVLDFFAARYGDQVLQEPPKRGFTLVLWVLPVIAILAAAAWLVYTMWGWTNPEPATTVPVDVSPTQPEAASPDVTDDNLKQVERDLGLDESS